MVFEAEAPERLGLFGFGAGERCEGLAQLGLDADLGGCCRVEDDEDFLEQGLVHELLDVLGRVRVGGSAEAITARDYEVEAVKVLIVTYTDRYGQRIAHGDAEFHVDALLRLAGWQEDL